MHLRTKLAPRLVALTEDAFFAVASMCKLDVEALHALAARRVAAQAVPQGMDAWDEWVLGLCVAIAPIAPPRWMPMAEAVAAGVSLEHGARGVRSLFTSKPSDRDVARVRDLGSLATQALGAVLTATGPLRGDARFLRSAFVASLGLPDADHRALDVEEPGPVDRIAVRAGIDAKVARGIVRGAFYAALSDGLDPREEEVVLAIGKRLNVSIDDVNEARADAKKSIDAAKGFGDAAVESVRFVLSDDPQEAERFAIAAARLALPAVHRRDAVTAINQGVPVTLGKRHDLDKRSREAVLALAWIAALRTDPTFSARGELADRHNAVAKDLGDAGMAPSTRATLESFLETELLRV